MALLFVLCCLIVSFSLLISAFGRSRRAPLSRDEIRDWDFVEDNGIHSVSSNPDVEEDRHLTHESISSRQPTTDIVLQERRVGEVGVSSDLDDREISTKWRPYFTEGESTRLNIYEQTPDLKHAARTLKAGIDLLRGQGTDRFTLSELLEQDRFSQAGKKFQTAIRSLIAGASMRGIPANAACVATINIAATPELPIWLAAGGAHPLVLKDDLDRKYREALDEIGCKHILQEGLLEIAMSPKIDLHNKKAAAFVKSYASLSWPSALKLEDHLDGIAVPHVHRIVVLLDENGQPIPAKLLRRALKKRFPAKRAVVVTSLGASRRTKSMPLAQAAEAAIRYALERKKGRKGWEIREQARWNEKLRPEDLWTTGWTSFVDVRPLSVPIMRASLLSRQHLREALVCVDIGPGWTPLIPAVEDRHALASHWPIASTLPQVSMWPIHAANDNDKRVVITRRSRDGPHLRAA